MLSLLTNLDIKLPNEARSNSKEAISRLLLCYCF